MKKIISMIIAIVLLCGMVGCTDDGTGERVTTTDTNTTVDTTSTEVQEQVLVDNDVAKVTFIEIYEEPSVPSTCYVRLNVENKSDKTVMVSLKDSYVNDMVQTMGTGVPIVLAPGKSSQQPFFFGYGNLGITNKSEISKMEFKVWLMDDDTYDTVLETDSLIVNIK